MKSKKFGLITRIVPLILLAALAAACAEPAASPPPSAAPEQTAVEETGPVTLTVMTHDSFAVSEEVVRQFEEENNIDVEFLLSGDAGSSLNRAILSKDTPLADVFFGVDNTFLSRALEADIFEPYDSPVLANIPDQFKLDPQNRALPVDYGDVCINYDKSYFESNNLSVPQSLQDLTRPEYNGLLVVENPATSSPGLAFLMATVAEFGEDGYIDFWGQLRDNGVVVVNDWSTAYYTNFSGSSGQGPQPMVVSYGSSPVAEVVFAESPPEEAPTGSIIGPNTCYRQIEFVGILQGAQQRAAAEAWVDFMLSEAFQEGLPLQMFVYPVNQNAALPDAFQQHAQMPAEPAMLDADLIAQNRSEWVEAWDETVLR